MIALLLFVVLSLDICLSQKTRKYTLFTKLFSLCNIAGDSIFAILYLFMYICQLHIHSKDVFK